MLNSDVLISVYVDNRAAIVYGPYIPEYLVILKIVY